MPEVLLGVVGDEKHMIFECPAVGPWRDTYGHLFLTAGQIVQGLQKDKVGLRSPSWRLEVMRDNSVTWYLIGL